MKKKILLVILTIMLFQVNAFADDIYIDLPDYTITLNGSQYNNEKEKYPIIRYKNVLYLPMSDDMMHALGVNGIWIDKENFKINEVSRASLYHGENKNTYSHPDFASIPNFNVFINDVEFKSDSYPALCYKEMLYIPLTYQIAKKEFALDCFSNNNVLFIDVDEKKVVIDPIDTICLEFSAADTDIDLIREDGLITRIGDSAIGQHMSTFILDYKVKGENYGLYYDVSKEYVRADGTTSSRRHLEFGNRYFSNSSRKLTQFISYMSLAQDSYNIYLDFYSQADYDYMLSKLTKTMWIEYATTEEILDLENRSMFTSFTSMSMDSMDYTGMSIEAIARKAIYQNKINSRENSIISKVELDGFINMSSNSRFFIESDIPLLKQVDDYIFSHKSFKSSEFDEVKKSDDSRFMTLLKEGKVIDSKVSVDVVVFYDRNLEPYSVLINERLKGK